MYLKQHQNQNQQHQTRTIIMRLIIELFSDFNWYLHETNDNEYIFREKNLNNTNTNGYTNYNSKNDFIVRLRTNNIEVVIPLLSKPYSYSTILNNVFETVDYLEYHLNYYLQSKQES